MGRHDLTLAVAMRGRAGLAAGLYADTPVRTAAGWLPMAALGPGDLLVTPNQGLCPISATGTELRAALWAVLVPAGVLDNPVAVLLPPGQPVLLESSQALPFTGMAQALVPAAALEGWRGIAPHVPLNPAPILTLRLPRPGLVQAGPGLTVAVDGIEGDGPEPDLIRLLLTAPGHAVLPLAAARHLVATLIAADTGQGLRAADQATLFRPAKRP